MPWKGFQAMIQINVSLYILFFVMCFNIVLSAQYPLIMLEPSYPVNNRRYVPQVPTFDGDMEAQAPRVKEAWEPRLETIAKIDLRRWQSYLGRILRATEDRASFDMHSTSSQQEVTFPLSPLNSLSPVSLSSASLTLEPRSSSFVAPVTANQELFLPYPEVVPPLNPTLTIPTPKHESIIPLLKKCLRKRRFDTELTARYQEVAEFGLFGNRKNNSFLRNSKALGITSLYYGHGSYVTSKGHVHASRDHYRISVKKYSFWVLTNLECSAETISTTGDQDEDSIMNRLRDGGGEAGLMGIVDGERLELHSTGNFYLVFLGREDSITIWEAGKSGLIYEDDVFFIVPIGTTMKMIDDCLVSKAHNKTVDCIVKSHCEKYESLQADVLIAKIGKN